MADLEAKFNEMAAQVENGTIAVNADNNQKLKLYAFYKQATQGDITEEQPPIYKMVERAKWGACNAVKGKTKEEAMESYIKLCEEI